MSEPHIKPLSHKAEYLKSGIYRHFKGPLYRVLGVGRLSESREEELVIYTSLDNNAIWLRPIDMFCEEVDKSEYAYKGPRFQFLRKEE